MPIATPVKSPLRDRRRAAVERIALDLALEHGYDAVTVEMICDAALVSMSTFFSYFGSKYRAVLGPEPGPLDEQRLAAFAAGRGDALTAQEPRIRDTHHQGRDLRPHARG